MIQNTPGTSETSRVILALDDRIWSRIVESLRLSPQQVRIVGLILRGFCDKEIATELRLTVPTVRTHLSRIFQRNGIHDRIGLILHIFALAQARWIEGDRHSKE